MKTLSETEKGLLLEIYVQPRSSTSGLAGIFDGRLKIRLKAPPVDNAANKECLRLLAKKLGLAKSRLSIVAGKTSKRKKILISWPEEGPRTKAAKSLYQALENLLQNSS